MIATILFWGLAVVVSGLGVCWSGFTIVDAFERRAERRAIEQTPVATIDAAAVGPNAVEGVIEPVEEPFDVPPAGSCVAYDLTIEDIGADRSETYVDHHRAATFDILTSDGSIRVRESDLDLKPSDERRWKRSRKSHETLDESDRAVDRHWELDELRMGDTRQYDLEWLAPGDEVYAYGVARIDEQRDGAKPLQLTGSDGPFFVSDRSPEALAREYRFAVAKSIAFGTIVGTVSLAALLLVTGIAFVL